MIVNASKLIPPRSHETLGLKIITNPFVRLFIYLVCLTLVLVGSDYLLGFIGSELSISATRLFGYGKEVFNIFLLFITYFILVKYIEKRPVYELSFSMVFSEIIVGILLGTSLILLVVGILLIPGYVVIHDINSAETLVNGLFRFVNGAFFEEMLFRLIIFKLFEEYLGSWISLIFSALLFGVAHIFNENATLWSAFAIAIEAGLLLTFAFMLTRRIWLAFGLHFAWNYMQSTVFGLPASGIHFTGLITSEISGPEWLTGGSFGVEASSITVIFGLCLSWILLRKALNDDQTILPAWKQKRKTEIRY